MSLYTHLHGCIYRYVRGRIKYSIRGIYHMLHVTLRPVESAGSSHPSISPSLRSCQSRNSQRHQEVNFSFAYLWDRNWNIRNQDSGHCLIFVGYFHKNVVLSRRFVFSTLFRKNSIPDYLKCFISNSAKSALIFRLLQRSFDHTLCTKTMHSPAYINYWICNALSRESNEKFVSSRSGLQLSKFMTRGALKRRSGQYKYMTQWQGSGGEFEKFSPAREVASYTMCITSLNNVMIGTAPESATVLVFTFINWYVLACMLLLSRIHPQAPT